MRFERYACYKDSGVAWLGEIPCEWGIRRIKEIFSIAEGQVNPLVEPYKSMILIAPNHIEKNTGKIIYTETSSEQGAISGKYYVHSGELIYSKIRPALNKICKIDFDCLCSADMYPLKVNNQSNNSYYMQVFLCIDFVNYVSADSSRVAMPKVNRDSLRLYRFPFPPLKTQQKIATYLDTQTQKIDKEINLLEQKIEKYKELKQTLINETVLRGLDKVVELKDSGIEWIGEIPKGWTTDRLKNIFDERIGKNLNKNTGKAVTTNILSVMKDVGVINHRDKGNVGNKMAEDITNYKLVYPNDIVVNKMNIMIGSVGISKEFGALSVIYIILITKKGSFAKYYDYFFKMKAFQKSLRCIATGILEIREAVNMTLFTQEAMTVPPYVEQIEIANYLDKKTQKIDNITKTISKKIELLKEFRKTLVNDVVTGRVKVY